MREAVLADAGPLYAAVDPSDAQHDQARRELRDLGRAHVDVFVPFSTLLEAYSLVLRRMGGSVAHQWLNEMAYAAVINPSAEDYRQAISRVAGFADQSITLFDATLAMLALRMQIPVWTYDRHFDGMRVPVWRGRP